jgi:carboxyl-terminal processing protease
VDRAAAANAPRCLTRPDPAADAYALNVAVSGRRAQPRRLGVLRRGEVRSVDLPLVTATNESDVTSRRLDGGFGLIRIASFANASAVAAFDAALADLRESRGLILDVRRNGGGDTAVARPIMGRFISETLPYAHMRRRAGAGLSAPWTETVEPRGPFTYARPVVVLCDRWSGSMAEGFPMGMRGIGRARIVGTPMMGLGAAVFEIRLDRTGVEAQYSGEPVYDVAGAPRWLLRPDVEVRPGADILAAGIAELSRIAGPA